MPFSMCLLPGPETWGPQQPSLPSSLHPSCPVSWSLAPSGVGRVLWESGPHGGTAPLPLLAAFHSVSLTSRPSPALPSSERSLTHPQLSFPGLFLGLTTTARGGESRYVASPRPYLRHFPHGWAWSPEVRRVCLPRAGSEPRFAGLTAAVLP